MGLNYLNNVALNLVSSHVLNPLPLHFVPRINIRGFGMTREKRKNKPPAKISTLTVYSAIFCYTYISWKYVTTFILVSMIVCHNIYICLW